MRVERIGEGEADPGDAGSNDRWMRRRSLHPHGLRGDRVTWSWRTVWDRHRDNPDAVRHRDTIVPPEGPARWPNMERTGGCRKPSGRKKFSRASCRLVALATAATIFCAAASISGSVSVRSFGWRRTAMASDFCPRARPCLHRRRRDRRARSCALSAPAAARIRSAAATEAFTTKAKSRSTA